MEESFHKFLHSEQVIALTFGVQHFWDIEVLLSNIEGQVKIFQRIILIYKKNRTQSYYKVNHESIK